MIKAELIALIQKQHDDKMAGAAAAIDAEYAPMIAGANALEVAPDDSGLQAQIVALNAQMADMQAKLDAASASLQAEVAMEEADAAKIVALNGKISAALSALQA